MADDQKAAATVVVAASGTSLTSEQIELALARAPVVAVSDVYKLTGDRAAALAASDGAWWKVHPEAARLSIPKYTLAPRWANDLPKSLLRLDQLPIGSNSGLLGLAVAVHVLRARRVILLGIDLNAPGEHFFGKHPAPLKSSTPDRFRMFAQQFREFRPRGVTILNCAPGSALDVYPRSNLDEALLAESPALPS